MIKEMKAGILSGVAALQIMVDCMVLGVPNNITPIIMIAVVAVVWAVKRPRPVKRRKPVFYDLKEGME